jgi:hypothetical protein
MNLHKSQSESDLILALWSKNGSGGQGLDKLKNPHEVRLSGFMRIFNAAGFLGERCVRRRLTVCGSGPGRTRA